MSSLGKRGRDAAEEGGQQQQTLESQLAQFEKEVQQPHQQYDASAAAASNSAAASAYYDYSQYPQYAQYQQQYAAYYGGAAGAYAMDPASAASSYSYAGYGPAQQYPAASASHSSFAPVPRSVSANAHRGYSAAAPGSVASSTPSAASATPSSSKITVSLPSKGDLSAITNSVDESGKKKVIRMAAGEVWEDPTMVEWNPDDYRIFCGDLGNEVTDDMLANSFRKFPSFQKARVVRDKRTCKSKGYGFVSFKEANDYIRAMREMNGKYVGNRPVKLRKSNWADRNVDSEKNKERNEVLALPITSVKVIKKQKPN